jgi:hypothetical protein
MSLLLIWSENYNLVDQILAKSFGYCWQVENCDLNVNIQVACQDKKNEFGIAIEC